MTDTFTPEQRSRCMAAIKSKNTRPEELVRKRLFSLGLRYRLHNAKLPGKPDLTFKKYKAVVFINGCFWHGHEGCPNYRFPKSNTAYWSKKIGRNRQRDAEVDELLKKQGWRIFRVWECQLKNRESRDAFLDALAAEIKSEGR